MVSGVINQKSVNEIINDIHFVAYEVIKPVLKTFGPIWFPKCTKRETVYINGPGSLY